MYLCDIAAKAPALRKTCAGLRLSSARPGRCSDSTVDLKIPLLDTKYGNGDVYI